MKEWKIIGKDGRDLITEEGDELLTLLLQNRGITTKKDREVFLHTTIDSVSLETSDIDKKEFLKFKDRVEKAIKLNEKIIIFGDYDVDGICASAILWETLFVKTKNVFPYIPDRADEGYGLSIKGIDNVCEKYPEVSLIITVDNGIVAYDAISYAQEKGIDVIVTDHHVQGQILPNAYCIVHTTSLCGAGIAWVIAHVLGYESGENIEEKLELATLATIADLVPLTGNNRAIVKKGLTLLRTTKRPGIKALLKEADIDPKSIDVYTIGHIIAPRINATGRIQSAMNALRLLCSRNEAKVVILAQSLGKANRDRQDLTESSVKHAKLLALEHTGKVIVVSDESYNQGIIGLVASQLVEQHYKPSLAIAKGETISKGSARSIKGVNIIELLRSVSDTLIEVGGHPMAAGFSIETIKIEAFVEAINNKAEKIITEELLKRVIVIDGILSFKLITKKLIEQMRLLEPYGMANAEPVFATKEVDIIELRKIGKERNHLKLKVASEGVILDAIAFKMADKVDVSEGDTIDIAYTVNENEWNGKKSIQLKIRDLRQP